MADRWLLHRPQVSSPLALYVTLASDLAPPQPKLRIRLKRKRPIANPDGERFGGHELNFANERQQAGTDDVQDRSRWDAHALSHVAEQGLSALEQSKAATGTAASTFSFRAAAQAPPHTLPVDANLDPRLFAPPLLPPAPDHSRDSFAEELQRHRQQTSPAPPEQDPDSNPWSVFTEISQSAQRASTPEPEDISASPGEPGGSDGSDAINDGQESDEKLSEKEDDEDLELDYMDEGLPPLPKRRRIVPPVLADDEEGFLWQRVIDRRWQKSVVDGEEDAN